MILNNPFSYFNIPESESKEIINSVNSKTETLKVADRHYEITGSNIDKLIIAEDILSLTLKECNIKELILEGFCPQIRMLDSSVKKVKGTAPLYFSADKFSYPPETMNLKTLQRQKNLLIVENKSYAGKIKKIKVNFPKETFLKMETLNVKRIDFPKYPVKLSITSLSSEDEEKTEISEVQCILNDKENKSVYLSESDLYPGYFEGVKVKKIKAVSNEHNLTAVNYDSFLPKKELNMLDIENSDIGFLDLTDFKSSNRFKIENSKIKNIKYPVRCFITEAYFIKSEFDYTGLLPFIKEKLYLRGMKQTKHDMSKLYQGIHQFVYNGQSGKKINTELILPPLKNIMNLDIFQDDENLRVNFSSGKINVNSILSFCENLSFCVNAEIVNPKLEFIFEDIYSDSVYMELKNKKDIIISGKIKTEGLFLKNMNITKGVIEVEKTIESENSNFTAVCNNEILKIEKSISDKIKIRGKTQNIEIFSTLNSEIDIDIVLKRLKLADNLNKTRIKILSTDKLVLLGTHGFEFKNPFFIEEENIKRPYNTNREYPENLISYSKEEKIKIENRYKPAFIYFSLAKTFKAFDMLNNTAGVNVKNFNTLIKELYNTVIENSKNKTKDKKLFQVMFNELLILTDFKVESRQKEKELKK